MLGSFTRPNSLATDYGCTDISWLRFALLLAFAPLLGRAAHAQQSVTTDTLRGQVTEQNGIPIAFAHVRVAGEDGRRHGVLTDSAGHYAVVVNGNGIYELRVTMFGYVPLTVVVQRPAIVDVAGGRSGARIERDVRMSAIPVSLATVSVVAAPSTRSVAAPGDRGARWLSALSESLPVDLGEIGATASLQPGVSRVGPNGSDLSVLGQSPDQNHTTVDGASSTGSSLPAEGVRSSGVVANSYDVSRRQFSGGELTATTISGTNIWGGALAVSGNVPALEYGSLPGSPSRSATALRVSSGGGGPVIRDRAFVYGALDVTHSTSPRAGLELLDPAALERLNISPDSAARMLAIANTLGVYSPNATADRQVQSDFANAFARADYVLTEHHSLMVRVDGRRSRQTGLASAPLTLSPSGGDLQTRDAGILTKLTSTAGSWANDLSIYRTSGRTTTSATRSGPAGEVQVLSAAANGAVAPSIMNFGGSSFAIDQHHTLLEVADDVVRETANGTHRFHAGIMSQSETMSSADAANLNGAFTFNSLGDLAAGRPASFTRNVGAGTGTIRRDYTAGFASDIWHPNERLWLTYGLRMDGTRYGKRAALAGAVDSLAPDARGQLPSDLSLTPRIGFRYDIPSRAGWTVDGGVGGFAGVTRLAPLAALWRETGTGGAMLTCIGPAAPTPDWRAYGVDPATIPSTCVGGSELFSSVAPSAEVFGKNFRSPRTWRASIGLNGNFTPVWGVMVDALLLRGMDYPSAIDRNLSSTPRLALPDENGRLAYVTATDIDPATGGIAPAASRIDPMLGSLVELGSSGKAWTGELSAGVTGPRLSLYYTYTRSRMLEGGVPAPGVYDATTAGNPSQLEWHDGAFAPRHTLQMMASGGIASRVRLTAIGRLSSGLPFTPMVASDINGDGFANDRAFVFDPATTADPALAAAMNRLRETASPGIAACLRGQAGRIAGPGSCQTSWTPSLDLRAELYAVGNINSRRLMLTLTASNVTAGVDYLLHGPDHLRGWGEYPTPDATLLQARGFDPARRAFNYVLNPHFGQPLETGLQRLPFRLTLQARITFGSDPRYQPMLSAITAGMGSSSQSVRSWLARYVHNIPSAVLQIAGTDTTALKLTLQQRVALQTVSDSLSPAFASAVTALAAAVLERGPMTVVRRAHLQERSATVESLVHTSLERTRQILTPDQFAQLPGWLVRPPTGTRLQRPEFTTTVQSEGP